MGTVAELVQPKKNEKIVEYLRGLLAKAETGEVVGVAGVQLRHNNAFGTFRIGDCSDLELAGALTFALHDLIAARPAEGER